MVFLMIVTPPLAVMLAVMGLQTLPTYPVAWFLFICGLTYTPALVISRFVRGKQFWEPRQESPIQAEEKGDLSFWLITAGMSGVVFMPPLEVLVFPLGMPMNGWTRFGGLAVLFLGCIVFGWARRVLRKSYSGHLTVSEAQELVQSGPYALVRHPAYAGYLLIALGIVVGFSSGIGLGLFFLLLIPGTLFRIRVEEQLLAARFSSDWQAYTRRVPALLPRLFPPAKTP